MRFALLGLALLVVSVETSQAEILASAPSYNSTQASVRCRIYNAGSAAVTVNAAKVTAELSPNNLPISSFCGASLAGGRACFWEADIRTGGAHLCRVDISSKTTIRGVMEIIQRGTGNVLTAVEMR